MIIRLSIWLLLGHIIFLPGFSLAAKAGYTEGDWVSFGPVRSVRSIAIGREKIYFGTIGAGVLRLDRYSEKWLDPLTTSDGLPSNDILRIAYDPDNYQLWIDTNMGTGTYESTFQDFMSGGIFPTQLEQRKSNYEPENLFMEFGYTYFPGQIIDPQGRKHRVNLIVKDDRYRAWVGVNGLGAGVINTRSADFELLPFGPFSADVRAVAAGKENLYAGGYPGPGYGTGFARLRFDRNEWTHYEAPYIAGLHDARANCIRVDKDVVWLGGVTGLVRFDTFNEDFRTFTSFDGLLSNYIGSIGVDDEYLWVGTDNGINLIKFGGEDRDSIDMGILPREQAFFGQFIYDIEIDDNFVYVGNQEGLFYRPRRGGQWIQISPSIIGGSRDITAVLPVENGVWVGIPGEIVFVNLKEESRQGYAPPGLSSAFINDLIVYDDLIFAATDNGLAGIDPATGRNRMLTEEDGLITTQVYGLALHQEYLWCATAAGLTRVYIPALKIY